MTPDNFSAFARLYRQMAVILQRYGEITPEVIETTFRLLADFPLGVVLAAGHDLMKTAAAFPVPATWADACTRLMPRASPASPLPDPGDGVVCDTCQDTGWASHTCPAEACGRTKPHAQPHPYVTPCACRATNPYCRARLAALQS